MIKRTPIIPVNVDAFKEKQKHKVYYTYKQRGTEENRCEYLEAPNPNSGTVLVRATWEMDFMKFVRKIKIYQYKDAYFIAIKSKSRLPYYNRFVYKDFRRALNGLNAFMEEVKNTQNVDNPIFQVRYTKEGKKKLKEEGLI
jgi:hypothetical protein